MFPIWSSTLYHCDDLPFDPSEFLPNTYSAFRKKCEDTVIRRTEADVIKGQLFSPKIQSEIFKSASKYLPNLETDFGFTDYEILVAQGDPRSDYEFHGGESNGLKRLKDYLYTNRSLSTYKNTRNNLMGSEYSSKLSPWLADGSLSIRRVFEGVL